MNADAMIVPSHHIPSEQALIGALMLDNSRFADLVSLHLTPKDFYRREHQIVFEAIGELYRNGQPFDIVTVSERLESMGVIEDVGGLSYLAGLTEGLPIPPNTLAYAERIVDRATRRRLAGIAEIVMGDSDTERKIDLVRQTLDEVQARRSRSGHLDVWDCPADALHILTTEPSPISWLVRDRMQLGRGCLITGLGGSSKTRLLYHLAIGVVTGFLSWDWEISSRGRAVLVLTEDTAADVHRTLHHTCRTMNLSEHESRRVAESLVLYPLAGVDVRLLATGDGRHLFKTAHFDELDQRVKSIGNVVFVGLDPALSLTMGDEMDQGHQRALGKMTDDLAVRTGATVALVSHATKSSLQTDELASHNSRGGGAITDAVRAEYALRTMTVAEAAKAGITDLEERKRHVQLVCTKGNHLSPSAFVPVWLRRGEHGVLSGADLSFDQAEDLVNRDAKALDVLREMAAVHVPTLAEWRDECLSREVIAGKNDEAVRKTMQRVVKKLRDAGQIESGIGRGRWVPVAES